METKKFLAAKGSILAAAAFVMALVMFFCGCGKKYSTPEEHYHFVETKQIETLTATFSKSYDTYVGYAGQKTDRSDFGVDFEIEIEIDDSVLGMVQTFLPMVMAGNVDDVTKDILSDLSWLSSIGADFNVSIKDSLAGMEASVLLKKDTLLSANILMDMEQGKLYLQIPELSGQYLGADLDLSELEAGFHADILQDGFEENELKVEALPDADTLEDLLNRYITIVIEQITDVSETKDTLAVGEIEQECTLLTVRIDQKTVNSIVTALLENAKNDKTLKEIVVNYVTAYGNIDESEARSQYDKLLTSALEGLTEFASSSSALYMNVWVDGKDNVIGRSFGMTEGDGGDSFASGQPVISYYRPQKGDEYELEVMLAMNGDIFLVEGSGKDNGSKLNGDFEVLMNNKLLFDLKIEDYDLKAAEKGYNKGVYTIKLSPGFLSELIGTTYFGTVGLKLDMDISEKKSNVGAEILMGDTSALRITTSTKVGSAKRLSIPSENVIMLEDGGDVINWLKTIEYKDWLTSLRSKDLPDSLVDLLEKNLSVLDLLGIF